MDVTVSDPIDVVKLEHVARKAGVSNATASRALTGAGRVSEEARRRTFEAAEALSYRPNRSAQALKGGRSGMIGMVVPRLSDLFFASCVDAVEVVAMRNSTLLVVAATHDRDDRTVDAMQRLLDHKVDGMVLACSEYISSTLARTLRSLPIPVVGIDAPLTKAGLPSVLIDNLGAAEQATEHLIANGYDCIISVQIDPTLYTMQERQRGYECAMRKAGLDSSQYQIHDRKSAEDLLHMCQSKPGKYALLAGNEPAAKHIIAAAKRLALHMPTDFAMVSFDDFELAEAIETPLTVVRQPVHQIGEAAANLLFQNMSNGNQAGPGPLERTLRAELAVRQSSGSTASRSST